jgi:hypothetical protein
MSPVATTNFLTPAFLEKGPKPFESIGLDTSTEREGQENFI